MKTRIVINHVIIEAEPEDIAEAVRLAFDVAFAPLRAGLAQLETVEPPQVPPRKVGRRKESPPQ